ncbi:uncharacterized protein LOC116130729 [Pistacia vera]|uniref:uncharacterized protein LOC116130729 n=1 Tax=Pistacia vera TaxID=55513 RepID=UPI0012638778|nr:uncharacterized protein LOC116130729 [Pistacia vera]
MVEVITVFMEGRALNCGASYNSVLHPTRVASKNKDLLQGLAKKVNQAGRDRRKILNLLRGFFYWLKNLCKEGAFLPWMDSQCLSTLPPVKLGDLNSQRKTSTGEILQFDVRPSV